MLLVPFFHNPQTMTAPVLSFKVGSAARCFSVVSGILPPEPCPFWAWGDQLVTQDAGFDFGAVAAGSFFA